MIALVIVAPLLAAGAGTLRLLDHTTRASRSATDAAVVSEQIQVMAVVAAQASAPGADLASLRQSGLAAGVKAQATMDRLMSAGFERARVVPLNRRLSEYYASLARADQLFGRQDLPEARRMATASAALVPAITELAGNLVTTLRDRGEAAARMARILMVGMLCVTAGTISVLIALIGRRRRNVAVLAAGRAARAESAEELTEMNRVLRTITAADEALVHAPDEQSLLVTMCRMIVDTGGYPSAQVVLRSASGTGEISAAAAYGPSCGDASVKNHLDSALRDTIDSIEHRRTFVTRDLARACGCAALGVLPLADGDAALGALVITARDESAFGVTEAALLEGLADNLAFGIGVLRTRAERHRHFRRVEQSFKGLVRAVGATVELRDPYTAGHQRTVADLAVSIAREMRFDPDHVEGIRVAAGLHDIGKVAVPAEILAKPGRLTPIEFEMIKCHPQAGADILADVDFPWPVTEMILQHHERMDGSGYPSGLTGPEILPGARIIAVADMIDAMSSHRPYRPGLGIEAAMRQIEHDRGTLLDADVVDACLKVVRSGGLASKMNAPDRVSVATISTLTDTLSA